MDSVQSIIVVALTSALIVWRCSCSWDRRFRDSRAFIVTLIVFVTLLYVVTSFTIGAQWGYLGALVIAVVAIGVRLGRRVDADKSLWPFLWIFMAGAFSLATIDTIDKWLVLQSHVSSLAILGVLLIILASVAIKEGGEGLRKQEDRARDAQEKRGQKERARGRVKGLHDDVTTRRARELLDRIYHEVAGGADGPVRMSDLVGRGEEIGDIWLQAHLLARLGDVNILDDDDPCKWTERVQLTAQGYNRAAKREHPVAGISAGGDVIIAERDAVVFSRLNRPVLLGAMNKVRSEVGKDVADALRLIGDEVSRSKNPEAVELFNKFNRELQSDNPNRPLLKGLFGGIRYAVPAIEGLADATAKIVGLFS